MIHELFQHRKYSLNIKPSLQSQCSRVSKLGGSGPHQKKSCLGSHIEDIVTRNHKQHLVTF